MTYVLPRTVEMLPRESLGSFIVRTAGLYGFPKPLEMFARVPHPPLIESMLRLNPNSPMGRSIGRFLGFDDDAFAQLVYGTPNSKRLRIMGHQLHVDHVNVSIRRFCPICLDQGVQYHRVAWDLRAMTVCTAHSVRLQQQCPKCRRRQIWNTSQIGRCFSRDCLADLRAAAKVVVPNLDMAGAVALEARLASSPDQPFPFGNGNLGDWIRLLTALPAVEKGADRRTARYQMFDLENAHLTLSRGAGILEGWPDTFFVMLDKARVDVARRQGQAGLAKEFGQLGRWIGSLKETPFERFVADVVSDYLDLHPDIPLHRKTEDRFIIPEKANQRPIPLTEAMTKLGVGGPLMRRLALRHNLYIASPVGHGPNGMLHRGRVETLARLAENQVGKVEFYQLLGIRRHRGCAEWPSLFPMIAEDDRVAPYAFVQRSAVRGFLARLESMVVPGGSGQLCRLPVCATRGRKGTVVDVCKAVLAEEIVPRAIDDKAIGLNRILVDRVEASDALLARMPSYSLVAAARRYDVPQRIVSQATICGILATSPAHAAPNTMRRVTKAAMDRFFCDYLFGKDLAREVGTKYRSDAAAILIAAGLKPVCAPSVRWATYCVFKRSDLALIDPKLLSEAHVDHRRRATFRRGLRSKVPAMRDLVAQVGADAVRALGRDYKPRFNVFADAKNTEIIRVVTARQQRRDGGPFVARLKATYFAELRNAREAWVVLAFVGRSVYALIPWRRIAHRFDGLPGTQASSLKIEVESDGCLEAAYAEFARRLPN